MRADRLLSILLLLQVQRRTTARALAQRLEVSERTIHRDMEALGAAGVPVVAERGAGGGWRLLDHYRTNLTGLNEAEVQALFVTKPAQLLADLGLAKAGEAALIKLLAALPSVAQRDAEWTRQRIHVDGAGWNRPEERVPLLPILHEAIWQERKLRIVYGRDAESPAERTLDPLGLVAKNSVWYLVAAVDDDLRNYRVSRMQHAELLDQIAHRPPDFDLAAFWEQSVRTFKANLPRYHVTLRVDPAVLDRLKRNGRYGKIEQIESAPDGWLVVAMRFDVEDVARETVLSLGPHVEVIEPSTLRAEVAALAVQTAALYRPPSDQIAAGLVQTVNDR